MVHLIYGMVILFLIGFIFFLDAKFRDEAIKWSRNEVEEHIAIHEAYAVVLNEMSQGREELADSYEQDFLTLKETIDTLTLDLKWYKSIVATHDSECLLGLQEIRDSKG